MIFLTLNQNAIFNRKDYWGDVWMADVACTHASPQVQPLAKGTVDVAASVRQPHSASYHQLCCCQPTCRNPLTKTFQRTLYARRWTSLTIEQKRTATEGEHHRKLESVSPA